MGRSLDIQLWFLFTRFALHARSYFIGFLADQLVKLETHSFQMLASPWLILLDALELPCGAGAVMQLVFMREPNLIELVRVRLTPCNLHYYVGCLFRRWCHF